MKCPMCNCDNSDTDNFCRYCGANLQYNKTSDDKEKYIEAFIGDQYNNFKNSTFNIGAFFLGPIYLFYRRMVLYGFVYLIICLFVPPVIANIILAFVINGIYLDFVRNKVIYIKNSNKDLDESSLLEKCSKTGKTSLVGPIILGIVMMIPVILFIYLVYAFIEGASYTPSNNSNTHNNTELIYEVPSGFRSINDHYFYSNDNKHYCVINITNSYNSNYGYSEEEYFKNHYLNKEIMTKDIHNKRWYYYFETNSYNHTDYKYMSLYENKLYTIDYRINKDEDGYCSQSMDSFVNSLKFVDKSLSEA